MFSPTFQTVPLVSFIQRDSFQSGHSPLSHLLSFFPVVCFVDPSNSSEWNSQVLVGVPGSSLMLCSVWRTPFTVSLHPAARRCNLLLLWSSEADLTSEVIKAFPRFSPFFLCTTGPFFVLCRYRGCRDDEYANRCTNMQKILCFSASTINPDDRENRNYLGEAHSLVYFLQRAIYSFHNSRVNPTVCRLFPSIVTVLLVR